MLEFHRVLKPGGRVLLRLPAYNWLSGGHDRAVHNAERFTAGEVRSALVSAGFVVEQLSYANTILFPLVVVEQLLETVLAIERKGSALQANPPWMNGLLTRVLYAEAAWLRHRSLPWGLSVIAVGRKAPSTGDAAR
jgi:hypothetical protein